MYDLLDLRVSLKTPPAGAPPEVVASLELYCDQLGLRHEGDLLTDPLTPKEREELRWYLEEYSDWPFEIFRERAQRIERKLSDLGKRLYASAFDSVGAQKVLQSWRLRSAKGRQISIVSGLPRALSLPWELLHDEQGFLVLRAQQPVSILRTLPQEEGASEKDYKPPLRILMVVARPEETGFIDPRGEAHELLRALHEPLEAGAIEVEFLRPPTLPALRKRLSLSKRPIHVLHFDGHGTFGKVQQPDSKDTTHKQAGEQGKLAFENEEGKLDLVEAEKLGQVLQDSTVSLVVLNACQSAQGTDDDAFSSVAGRLIQSGQDAVVAMSASVLVAATTRYVRAFYAEMAEGTPVPTAHERARQVLHDDPRRHLLSRAPDKEAEQVELRDWWLPHFYQQRTLTLRPSRRRRKRVQEAATHDLPAPPRYGFSGRTHELHRIERALWQEKLVVISGFGGVGKTTLAREAADWLTQTEMYQQALFFSFEQGGDATSLLSRLGHLLNIYGPDYDPQNHTEALAKLAPALKKQPLLLVADNLESLLPGGDTSLPLEERITLWETLLSLAKHKAGVLLTCRNLEVGDGKLVQSKTVAHLALGGLQPEAAYQLASDLLKELSIDRARAPYADLKELLKQLDHHPLAIQLVLPELARLPLETIRKDFATLLPQFMDDTITGRNRSLLVSLDYSLHRLSDAQRALLLRLALFEGGAAEPDILVTTQISKSEWASLRKVLQQSALLTVELVPGFDENTLFLRFHPVLAPFLRSQLGADDTDLRQRYAAHYRWLADYLIEQDQQHPEAARALAWRELPNLRRALDVLLEMGEQDAAAGLADCVARFLNFFGRRRELEKLRQQIGSIISSADEAVTRAEFLQENGLGEEELSQGNLRAAFARFTRLLERIEAQPESEPLGRGSYQHCVTLLGLSRCLRTGGQLGAAEARLRQALTIIESLLKLEPENDSRIHLQSGLLSELGNALSEQGKYTQAREAYETSLIISRRLGDVRNQRVILGDLGHLAYNQENYSEARRLYLGALDLAHIHGEPAGMAINWHQLGVVAQRQQDWAEAERCYRESLSLNEQLHDEVGAARTCNQLARVAQFDYRPVEAEAWYKRAIELFEVAQPGSKNLAFTLGNLAILLKNEVRDGRASATRLAEARGYAEQSLAIIELLGPSVERWTDLSTIAQIAEMEGRAESAHDYRRRERENFAAFEGNRYKIDQQYGQLITAVVETARGHAQLRAVDLFILTWTLPQRDADNITSAILRIIEGERDWHALAEGIDRNGALLILRILETLKQTPS